MGGAAPYLMRILSQPTKVNENDWYKFYTEEHIPDVVNAGVATRGAMFRAYNDFALTTKTPAQSGETKLHNADLSHFNELPADKTFCAVYQTNLEHYPESEEIKNVRQTSPALDGRNFHPLAEWDVRVYKVRSRKQFEVTGEIIDLYIAYSKLRPRQPR